MTSVIFSSSGTDAGVVTGSSGTSSTLDLKHDVSTRGHNTDGLTVMVSNEYEFRTSALTPPAVFF